MARTITGTVTSDKAAKTIVVTVTTRQTHPLYKKQYSRNTKYIAHDEKNQAKIGDVVVISECRPLSARKRFTLDKIVEVSDQVFTEADAEAGVEDLIKPKDQPKSEAEEASSKDKGKQ